jgi:antitoxin MazE
MPQTQIVKWGNSLAVRISKPLAEKAGVGEGDDIAIEASKGQIRLRLKQRLPTLQELVAEINNENRYGEISTGEESGKEDLEW